MNIRGADGDGVHNLWTVADGKDRERPSEDD